MRQGSAVGSVRGHGVVRIGDGDDARAEGDLLAGEAVRVAGSVPALVVMADVQPPAAEHAELVGEFATLGRVVLDEGPLVLSERGLLEQDAVVGGDLAEVVDPRRGDDHLDLPLGQSHGPGDLAAQGRHPLRVLVRVLVALVGRVGEGHGIQQRPAAVLGRVGGKGAQRSHSRVRHEQVADHAGELGGQRASSRPSATGMSRLLTGPWARLAGSSWCSSSTRSGGRSPGRPGAHARGAHGLRSGPLAASGGQGAGRREGRHGRRTGQPLPHAIDPQSCRPGVCVVGAGAARAPAHRRLLVLAVRPVAGANTGTTDAHDIRGRCSLKTRSMNPVFSRARRCRLRAATAPLAFRQRQRWPLARSCPLSPSSNLHPCRGEMR